MVKRAGRATILERSGSLRADSWESLVRLEPEAHVEWGFAPSVRSEIMAVPREQAGQRFYRVRYETPDR